VATIRNNTKKPLKVPLPGGKFLRLSPGKTGEAASKAVDHPPLRALVEKGEITILEGGTTRGLGSESSGLSRTTGHDPDRTIRRTGDG
jgi:hypothetical protein